MTKIPNDKLLHSFYGMVIYTLFLTINANISIIVVLLVAVLKELYDINKTGFSLSDILATSGFPLLLWIII